MCIKVLGYKVQIALTKLALCNDNFYLSHLKLAKEDSGCMAQLQNACLAWKNGTLDSSSSTKTNRKRREKERRRKRIKRRRKRRREKEEEENHHQRIPPLW